MMSALGDAIQVLPVLTALKRRFPRVSISWLIQPEPHELVRDHPAVDEFILFRRGPRGKAPGRLLATVEALRATALELQARARKQPGGRFDLLLDLQVYFKAGLLTALAPARIKLGFDFRRTRDLNWLFTNHRIPPLPGGFGHTQDQYLEFLRYLGVDPEPITYGLRLGARERAAQRAFFGGLDRPGCALVLATSNPRKDWHSEGYVRVAQGLYDTLGLQPILVGGRSAEEVRRAREVMKGSRVPILNAMGGGLRKLLWVMDGCSLVISPDTGPLHLARALEVPVVGLYGYTNPKRSGPYGMYGDLLVDGYAREPGEPYPLSPERRREGMERVTTEEVMEKAALARGLYV